MEKTAREYFNEIRRVKSNIITLKAELSMLEDMKGSIKAIDYSSVSVSGGKRSDIGDLIGKIDEIQSRLNDEIGRFVFMYNEATRLIDERIEDDTLRRTLRQYYLVGYTANAMRDKVVEGKRVSERTIRNYINDALKAFDKFIEFHGNM